MLVSGLKRRMKKDISTEKVAASFFGLFGMKVGMKKVSIRFLRPLRNSFMTESRDEIKLGLCLAKDFKEILCYFGGFLSRQSQRWFFLCIFRDAPWPEFNFAVIGNCTLRNVEGPVQPVRGLSHFGRHGFKLSNLSFAYLHRFSRFISFWLYLYREAERKITACLYVREGFENRPLRIFELFPQPTCLELRSQIQKGLFSNPSTICKACSIFSFLYFGPSLGQFIYFWLMLNMLQEYLTRRSVSSLNTPQNSDMIFFENVKLTC